MIKGRVEFSSQLVVITTPPFFFTRIVEYSVHVQISVSYLN